MKQLIEKRVHWSRRGSLVIEAVVVIALLATAFVALGKLAATSAALSQNADQRLAATLAAENLLQRLQSVSIDAVVADAQQIAKTIQDSCGYQINLKTDQFRASERDAIHVAVTVTASDVVSVTLHDWRIGEPASSDQGEDNA